MAVCLGVKQQIGDFSICHFQFSNPYYLFFKVSFKLFPVILESSLPR